jgi:anhydro-N-acetylmuramic acid kinase
MAEMMRALGLMSGTSLDGVDAALIETDGERVAGFGRSVFLPYPPETRALLRQALGRWPGEEGVAVAERVVREAHRRAVAAFPEAEIVGFHGQTLAHEPHGRGTHQAGCGALLAAGTGRPVVWDFRSADIAAGGEGAPLVPFFHFALAQRIGAGRPLAFLNIGGVANVTWVDPRRAAPEEEGALLAFDTGPGNALLDDFLRLRLGCDFDAGGRIASSGRPDAAILAEVADHPFLARRPPKSLDRLDFHGLLDRVAALGDADGAATLAAVTVATVAAGARHFPEPPERMLVGGGGRHNRALMEGLRAAMGLPVEPVEAVGLDGDMLEAQAFGFLAVRVLRGLPTSAPGTTGCRRPVAGGRLSLPRPCAGAAG